MARIPIGLELYSVRQDLDRDPRGTLKAVAEMGYEGVEFAGPPKLSGEELRKLLDEFGLVCCGWHTPFAMVQEDQIDATIALNKAVGNQYVIIPGFPGDLTKTRQDWLKLADFMNGLATKLAAHGMQTGYHNHHTEFQPLDGEWPWGHLLRQHEEGGDHAARYRKRAARRADPRRSWSAIPDARLPCISSPTRPAWTTPTPATSRSSATTASTGRTSSASAGIGGTRWYIVEYETISTRRWRR